MGSAAVGAVFGPGASAAAYLASEASRVVGVETNASRFLDNVSGNVGDIALDAVDGVVEELSGYTPNLGLIGAAKDLLKHSEHSSEGRRYDPDCPICKSW